MMKRFKFLCKCGRIHIMRWKSEGKLFGPEWETIASFDMNESNGRDVRSIVTTLNRCDRNSKHYDNE